MTSFNKWGRFATSSAASVSSAFSNDGGTPRKNPLPSPPSTKTASGNVEWETDLDDISRQQEQLINTQLKLMRQQIGSLTGSLSEMRDELLRLREVEPVLDNMVQAHDQHEQNHHSLQERVGYLETFINEVSENQATEIEKAKKEILEEVANSATMAKTVQEGAMDAGFQYLEGLVRDCAEKQTKDLESAFAECIKIDQFNSLDEHLKYLQQSMQQSTDELVAHHEKQFNENNDLVESRFSNLESMLNMSSKQFSDQNELVETRFEHLENMLELLPKQFAEHGDLVEARFGNLETQIAICEDNSSKHASDILAMQSECGETMKDYAKAEMHAGSVQSLRKSQDATEGRLGAIERQLQESEAKRLAEVEEFKSRFDSYARSDNQQDLEERFRQLERSLGENDAVERLSQLEKLLGENDAAKRLSKLEGSLNECDATLLEQKRATMECTSNLEVRIDEMKKSLDNDAGAASRQLEAANKKVTRIDEKLKQCLTFDQFRTLETTMEARIDSMMATFKDSCDKQSGEVEETKAKLQALEARLGGQISKLGGQTGMQARIDSLDKSFKEYGDKWSNALNDAMANYEALRSSFAELADSRTGNTSAAASELTLMKTRMSSLEASLKDAAWSSMSKALEEMKSKLQVLEKQSRKPADNHQSAVTQTGQITIQARIDSLETSFKCACDKWSSDLLATNSKLDALEAGERADNRVQEESVEAAELRQHSLQIKNIQAKLIKLEVEIKNVVDRRINALEGKYKQEPTELQEQEQDGSGILSKRLSELESGHIKIKKQCEELNILIHAEASTRSDMESRLMKLQDGKHDSSPTDSTLMIVDDELLKAKVGDMISKVLTSSEAEGKLCNGSGGFTQEIEKRIARMQDDVNKQQEMVEGSLQQLRKELSNLVAQASAIKGQEQLAHEVKARQDDKDATTIETRSGASGVYPAAETPQPNPSALLLYEVKARQDDNSTIPSARSMGASGVYPAAETRLVSSSAYQRTLSPVRLNAQHRIEYPRIESPAKLRGGNHIAYPRAASCSSPVKFRVDNQIEHRRAHSPRPASRAQSPVPLRLDQKMEAVVDNFTPQCIGSAVSLSKSMSHPQTFFPHQLSATAPVQQVQPQPPTSRPGVSSPSTQSVQSVHSLQPLTQTVSSIPSASISASITSPLPATTGPTQPAPTTLVRSLQSSMRSQPLTQSPMAQSPRLQSHAMYRQNYMSKAGGGQYE